MSRTATTVTIIMSAILFLSGSSMAAPATQASHRRSLLSIGLTVLRSKNVKVVRTNMGRLALPLSRRLRLTAQQSKAFRALMDDTARTLVATRAERVELAGQLHEVLKSPKSDEQQLEQVRSAAVLQFASSTKTYLPLLLRGWRILTPQQRQKVLKYSLRMLR